ncbi:MAG: phenylalanine--tRNA ligase subunit beta [Candidatus Paceibacterota bacterium]|jgi:phenylalanyl-tRNA synthetase beta chain
MLFSYNWLKKYVPTLPAPEKLEEGIIFHAFEVESLDQKNEDWVFEIKILPDRAHDCLCHLGLAREVAAIFNLTLQPVKVDEPKILPLEILPIKIEDEKFCRRYIGRRVANVCVTDSPIWLKKALENIGQRSINNVVDAANYVMFDLGQPLHAFDADKVDGAINVRFARPGEKIVTLDGDEVTLDESILIISDEKDPLAIAGLKGGKKAEVTKETKNLILEAANFEPVMVRKMSAKIKLKTDASKRFENEISTQTALSAMEMFSSLISELAAGDFGEIVDVYPKPILIEKVKIDPNFISRRLALEVSLVESKKIFEKLSIGVEEGEEWVLTPPHWRLDLKEAVNFVEEVGRIIGYDKIKSTILPNLPKDSYQVESYEKRFAVGNLIRQTLTELGFSELFGYAFADKGEVKVVNPLANDKAFLRAELTDWLVEKINSNLIHIIFDNEIIKIFEIGTVFPSEGWEEIRLAIGLGARKKNKNQDLAVELKKVIQAISEKIRWSGELPVIKNFVSLDGLCQVFEFNFEKIVDMAGPIEAIAENSLVNPEANYFPVSPYPRIIRDVAVWVSEVTNIEEIKEIILNSAGPLLLGAPILFDEFKKEGKKSLAFRLVLQSNKKTLSDQEANDVYDKIAAQLEQAGFEVRK